MPVTPKVKGDVIAQMHMAVSAKKVVALFGVWLFAMMIFNDLTNYGRIRIGFNLRPDRVIYAALLLTFFVTYRSGMRRVAVNREEFLMVAFFLIALTSCILFGAISAAHNRYIAQLWNFAVIPLTLFAIARRLVFDKSSMTLLSSFLKAVATYLILTSIFEHYRVEALVFPRYILDPDVGLHAERSRGPFGNAVVMGGAITLLFFWVLWEQRNLRRSWFNVVLLLLAPIAIYFTETRSVWVFFAVSLITLASLSKELRKPCYYIVACLALLYFSGVASKFSVYEASLFSRRQGPIDDRKNIMYASFKMFLARPIVGFGYGNYEKYNDDFFAELKNVELRGEGEGQHNTTLGLLAEMGLLGTVPFVMIYYLLIRRCVSRWKLGGPENRVQRSMAATQLSLLVGLLAYMQFSDVRFFNIVNSLTFFMAGVVYADMRGWANEGLRLTGKRAAVREETPETGRLIPELALR